MMKTDFRWGRFLPLAAFACILGLDKLRKIRSSPVVGTAFLIRIFSAYGLGITEKWSAGFWVCSSAFFSGAVWMFLIHEWILPVVV